MQLQADAAALQGNDRLLERGHGAAELAQFGALDFAAVARREHGFADALIHELGLHFLFGLDVVGFLLPLDAEQRRLGHVDMAGHDELIHLPVEEGEQQRADVRAVDVGVGHDDDLVVAPLGEIHFVADAGADGRDHAADFFVGQHFVVAALEGVDDLAAQRKDGLVLAQPSAFGAAAGRITFDQVQLAAFDVAAGAVAQLAGQAAATEGALAFADHQAGLAGRFAGFGRQQTLVDDDLGDLGVFFQVAIQVIAHGRIDDAFDLAVAELGFGLAFELRLGDAQRNDGRQAFAEIVARRDQIFEQPFFLAVVVQAAGQGRAEAGDVRAAFDGADVVDERADVLGVFGGVLHGDFQAYAFVLAGDVDHLGMGRLRWPGSSARRTR